MHKIFSDIFNEFINLKEEFELLKTSLTVNEMLDRVAILESNKIALICEDKSVTYKELQERSEILASWLLEQGAEKGERFLLWGNSSIEMIECMLACAKTGLIAVPINTRLSEGEVNYILQEVEPSFIFLDNTFPEKLINNSSIKGKITNYEDQDSHRVYYSSIINSSVPVQSIEVDISSTDPFFIIYTAAVDGNPKGAILTHKNVISCNLETKELLELNINDTVGIFTPLYHIAATSILFSSIHYGLTSVVLPFFEPGSASKKINEHNISIFCSFSPMAERLLEESNKLNIKLENHVRGIFGLDTPELINQLLDLGIDFYGIYAQTEVTGVIAAEKYQHPITPGLIGFPGPLSHIALLDDDGNEVSIGETGEICVRGETVFSGYWNREKDNNWVFRGGWLHSGDLASKDEFGRLWFKGRKSEKELIKSGGENVYPTEVEQALKKHSEVEEAVVFGVKDDEWLEAVKAVVKLKENNSVSEEELKQSTRKWISAYKVPKTIEFVDSIPEKNGEIDREAVKRMYGDS